MNILLKRLLAGMIRLLSTLIPKREAVVMASRDGYRANARAMAEALARETDWPVTWVAVNPRSEASLRQHGIPYCRNYSLRFWQAILTSRWLISTHLELGRFKAFRGQYFVNLFHGLTIKRVGHLWNPKDGRQANGVADRADLTCCPSLFMAGATALTFRTPYDRLRVTGLPRNDLQRPPEQARDLLQRTLNHSARRYLLYCPTHRQAEGPGQLLESDWTYAAFRAKYLDPALLAWLEAHQALLVVKLHPFDEDRLTAEDRRSPPGVRLLTGYELDAAGVDFYELLPGFDLMLTDYSSLFIDYLLTEHPILFMADDLETYGQRRGFLFDLYEELTPGPKIRDPETLRTELERHLADPNLGRERRRAARAWLHSAQPPFAAALLAEMHKHDPRYG